MNRADDIRESVDVYRDPDTDQMERDQIKQWWADLGIKNQFHAMLVAAEEDQS